MADIKNTVVVGLRLEDETQKGTQSARSQLKSLREEMLQLEQTGQRNTDRFRQLQTQAGGLADQIGDTQAQIKAMSSDTRTLDTLLGVGQGLAGAFAVAQGAAALFGDENEELQKAMLKVQAALAILNGVQAVANVLNKDSAVMVNLNATAQRAYAAAVGTSTGALKAFRLALAATGIGLAVVAVGMLAANFDKLSAAVKGFLGIQDQQTSEEAMAALNHQLALMNARGDEQIKILQAEHDGLYDVLELETDLAKKKEIRQRQEILMAQGAAILSKEAQANAKKEIEFERELQDLFLQNDELRLQEMNRLNNLDYIYTKQQKARQENAQQQRHIEAEFETAQLALQRRLDDGLISEQQRADLLVQIERLKTQKIANLNTELSEKIKAIRQAETNQSIQLAGQAFGAINDIMQATYGQSVEDRKKAFAANKKFSLAQAIISTYLAVNNALTAGGNPIKLATGAQFVEAGIALAAGLANVIKISKTQFDASATGSTGGSISTGGGSAALPPPTAMTPNSQILNPPANGQGQGMRAYVVESDIRSVSGRLRRMSEFATLGA
jgi:hypothetical protein